MRTIIAKAAVVLHDSRQFDTAEVAEIVGEYEPEIARLLGAVREMRVETGDPDFLSGRPGRYEPLEGDWLAEEVIG